MRHEQAKLYWTDERIVDGENPLQLGSNNSGKSVGGSTVHFAMVSLRFRPEWFKSRTLLGYGADWPLDWREMWRYYARGRAGAQDLRAGQLSLGPEAAALSVPRRTSSMLPRSCWPRARKRSASPGRRRRSRQSPRRAAIRRLASIAALCVIGCSTNAKQSALITWIPRALAAGAEIRDLAMVGRVEHERDGRATGVHYMREGRWRFQRARNVVVAGYAIETPRLCSIRRPPLSRRARQLARASSARI